MKTEKTKGFSLIEVIIAVVIFGLIIVWVIDIFRNLSLEKKFTLERSKINQNITILEKNIRDYINSADLDLDDNLSVIASGSSLNEIQPYFVPTPIISPAIYEPESRQLVIYYNNNINNNNKIDLILIRAVGNQINFEGFQGNDFLRFRVISDNARNIFWYFLAPNVNPNQLLNQLSFDRPILYPNGSYQVATIFRRQVIARNNEPIPNVMMEIIYQTCGRIANPSITPAVNGQRFITNPNLLYAEVRVNIYLNNRRRFSHSSILNFHVKHRNII